MAHDLIQDGDCYAIQCRVECTCMHKNARVHHEWSPLFAAYYTCEAIHEKHIQAIYAEGKRKLVPIEYHKDLEEGRIELIPLDQQYMPAVTEHYEGDELIKSNTNTGKSEFIKKRITPFALLQQCLKLFLLPNRMQLHRAYQIDATALTNFLNHDVERFIKLLYEKPHQQPANHQEAETWFKEWVLQKLLNVQMGDDGIVDPLSLNNVPRLLKKAVALHLELVDPTVLFISPLRSVAQMLAERFGAAGYLTYFEAGGTPEGFALLPVKVCSVESIQKCIVKPGSRIIMDEIATIFSRLNDKTIGDGDERDQKMKILFDHITSASACIAADQNLSRDIVKLLLDKRPPSNERLPVRIYYNVYSKNRTSIYLMKDDRLSTGFLRVLEYFAKHNSRAASSAIIPIVIPVNYATLAKKIEKALLFWDISITAKDILLISQKSKTKPQQRAAIENPTSEWCKYRYVIYTPTIQAGLDHNPKIPHFGVLIGQWGNGKFGICEYFIQAIARVRLLFMNTAFLFLPSCVPPQPNCTEKAEIKSDLKQNATSELSLLSANFTDSDYNIAETVARKRSSRLYDEGEMDIYTRNVALKRKSTNDAYGRVASLLRRAGHHILQIWPEHVAEVCNCLLEQYSFQVLLEAKDIGKPAKVERKSLVDKVLETKLTEQEEEELAHTRYPCQDRMKVLRFQVQQLLCEQNLESLPKSDIEFALLPDAEQKNKLFEWMITSEVPVEESKKDQLMNLYEVFLANPIITKLAVTTLLNLSGFPLGNDVAKQVICDRYLDESDSLAKLQEYLQENQKYIAEFKLLQSFHCDTSVNTKEKIVTMLKSLLKCCGLKFTRVTRTKENAGYQIDSSSWKCMTGIYKRKHKLDILYLQNHLPFHCYNELFPWLPNQEPIGFEIWSPSAKVIIVIRHRNFYGFRESQHVEHLAGLVSALDFCFTHCDCTSQQMQYRCLGSRPPDEQFLLNTVLELYRNTLPCMERISNEQKEEDIMVVDSSFFQQDDITPLLRCRDPSTGKILLWKASLWRSSFAFSKCCCGNACPKKCKRNINDLVCFDNTILRTIQ